MTGLWGSGGRKATADPSAPLKNALLRMTAIELIAIPPMRQKQERRMDGAPGQE
jgi:hypothetical protein